VIELNMSFLLKAFLRVAPAFIMLRFPVGLTLPMLMRLFISFPIALILSVRLSHSSLSAVPGPEDLVLGLCIGAFTSLFFSSAMKVSLFFAPVREGTDNDESPWRQVVDSFFFIFLLIVFMALRIERSLLEVLALSAKAPQERLFSIQIWSQLFNDLSWLALKMSSFGLVLVLTQKLFEEIYRKLGGESLKLVFSVCTWIALLVISPLLIPSFGDFVGHELAEFWKRWLGVSL
jgi:hypothetical protein